MVLLILRDKIFFSITAIKLILAKLYLFHCDLIAARNVSSEKGSSSFARFFPPPCIMLLHFDHNQSSAIRRRHPSASCGIATLSRVCSNFNSRVRWTLDSGMIIRTKYIRTSGVKNGCPFCVEHGNAFVLECGVAAAMFSSQIRLNHVRFPLEGLLLVQKDGKNCLTNGKVSTNLLLTWTRGLCLVFEVKFRICVISVWFRRRGVQK